MNTIDFSIYSGKEINPIKHSITCGANKEKHKFNGVLDSLNLPFWWEQYVMNERRQCVIEFILVVHACEAYIDVRFRLCVPMRCLPLILL